MPDNLKSGGQALVRYEPDLNPTYADMAEHYGCAVLPARPRKPRDKAKVEAGVLIAKGGYWRYCAIAPSTAWPSLTPPSGNVLERLNTRLLHRSRKSAGSSLKPSIEPNALPLPQRHYEYAEWRIATVNIDYHIEVDKQDRNNAASELPIFSALRSLATASRW